MSSPHYVFVGHYDRNGLCFYTQGIRPQFMRLGSFRGFQILARSINDAHELVERDLTRPFRVFQRHIRAVLAWRRALRRVLPRAILQRECGGDTLRVLEANHPGAGRW
jgi:hypothetical protein